MVGGEANLDAGEANSGGDLSTTKGQSKRRLHPSLAFTKMSLVLTCVGRWSTHPLNIVFSTNLLRDEDLDSFAPESPWSCSHFLTEHHIDASARTLFLTIRPISRCHPT